MTAAARAPCPHDISFAGICANCGEETGDSDPADPARVAVAYNGALSVSRNAGLAMEAANASRLLRAQKLSLVLDLDHTLIHATHDARAAAALHASETTPTRPTAILQSPKAPQHHTGVHALHFPDSPVPMYVKMRPGLGRFIQRAATKFELHIYTMGNRPYAEKIASLIDPTGTLFRGRITSRDDFPEGQLNQKNIRRVFPCDDSMVLIVDDNEKVWIEKPDQIFVPNLLVARPYRFWTGLDEAYNRDAATGVQLETKKVDTEPSDEKLTPELLNLVTTWSKADDQDRGHLNRLGEILEESHNRFFESLKNSKESHPPPSIPTANQPWRPPLHIKDLLNQMRSKVLNGCCLAFTGVYATNVEPSRTEPWLLAERLGATCETQLTPLVTHLLVDPRRGTKTSKVVDAFAQGGIFVLQVGWLTESAVNWRRVDERSFLLDQPSSEDYAAFKEATVAVQQARKAIARSTVRSDANEPSRKKQRVDDELEFEEMLAEHLCK